MSGFRLRGLGLGPFLVGAFGSEGHVGGSGVNVSIDDVEVLLLLEVLLGVAVNCAGGMPLRLPIFRKLARGRLAVLGLSSEPHSLGEATGGF